jgi:hypothetical protein
MRIIAKGLNYPEAGRFPTFQMAGRSSQISPIA